MARDLSDDRSTRLIGTFAFFGHESSSCSERQSKHISERKASMCERLSSIAIICCRIDDVPLLPLLLLLLWRPPRRRWCNKRLPSSLPCRKLFTQGPIEQRQCLNKQSSEDAMIYAWLNGKSLHVQAFNDSRWSIDVFSSDLAMRREHSIFPRQMACLLFPSVLIDQTSSSTRRKSEDSDQLDLRLLPSS